MFTDSMKESTQKEISLNGVTANGVEFIIEFIYTSKLQLNKDNIVDVLETASHFQLHQLVDCCEDFLKSQLDIENCVDIFILAETYSLTKLLNKVYCFICRHLLQFSLSSEFFRLNGFQLEKILSCDLPVDCSELDVLTIVLKWIKFKRSDYEENLTKIVHRLFRHIRFNEIPYTVLHRNLIDVINIPEIFCILDKKLTNSDQENNKNSLINSRGMILALVKIGGFSNNGLSNEITYYLPNCKKWYKLTKIPHIEQCNYGVAVMENELYIYGGSYFDHLEEYTHPFGFRYCPMSNKWTTIPEMLTERCRFTLSSVGHYLYAIGGFEQSHLSLLKAERYNCRTEIWEYIKAPPEHKQDHAAAVIEHFIYISGGMRDDVGGNILSTFYRYNTEHDYWEELSPMLTPRTDHVMIPIGNKLYICGGWHHNNGYERILSTTIDSYDVITHQWEIVTNVMNPKMYSGIVEIDKQIYHIGGCCSTDVTRDLNTPTIECYDIEKNVWSTIDQYPKSIWEHACATLYIPRCREDCEVALEENSIV